MTALMTSDSGIETLRHIFLAETKQLYEWFCPSIRHRSVCHHFSQCSYHRIITNFRSNLIRIIIFGGGRGGLGLVVGGGWPGCVFSPSVRLSALWLVAHFRNFIHSYHMWHKYKSWGDDVSRTICRLIGQRLRSHGSLDFFGGRGGEYPSRSPIYNF